MTSQTNTDSSSKPDISGGGEEEPNYQFKFNTKRLWIIAFVIVFVWGSLMVVVYLKYYEITNHPCSICAERLKDNFFCSSLNNSYKPIVFYDNKTVNWAYTKETYEINK